MTLPYRKKLIEVGLPLVAINAESAREKSIRHGHPSTLHLWWARRPLAACRAVLFSSLVDDPDSDPQYRKADGSVDEEAAGTKRADLFNLIEELVMWENSNNRDVIRTARAEIARCVASRLIETGVLKKDTIVGGTTTANDLVRHGHCRPKGMGLDKKVGRVRFAFDVSRLPPADVVNAFLTEHAPPVLDPFAGGGSIPLEAQRLGLRAYASDLNPVAVLINKALIEIPPKFAGRPPVNPASRGEGAASKGKGNRQKSLVEKEWPGATGLADDVRYYGQWMCDEAEKRIGHLYPKVEVTKEMAQARPDLLSFVGQKLTVIAWLWASQGKTKTGKAKYYLSKKPKGVPVDQVPDGYEIWENPENAIVSIRKIQPTAILTDERELLEDLTRNLAGIEYFCVDIQGDSLVLYTPGTDRTDSFDVLSRMFGTIGGGTRAQREWFVKQSTYHAMLRFTLVDENKRLFSTERWCFRGRIDGWLDLASGETLEQQAKTYLPHVEQESFFDLI